MEANKYIYFFIKIFLLCMNPMFSYLVHYYTMLHQMLSHTWWWRMFKQNYGNGIEGAITNLAFTQFFVSLVKCSCVVLDQISRTRLNSFQSNLFIFKHCMKESSAKLATLKHLLKNWEMEQSTKSPNLRFFYKNGDFHIPFT